MTPALNERLPVWRLIAALLVIGAMVTVLVALAPVYIEDYQLGQYMKSLSRGLDAQDDAIRSGVMTRARELDLPLRNADLQITRPGGKLAVQMTYVVQMDFAMYQVDVHFHHSAHQ